MTVLNDSVPDRAKKPALNQTRRYALFGVAFGLAFPIIGTLFVLWMAQWPIGLANLWRAQRSEPLLWIVDTIPVFLGLVAALAGRRQDNLEKLNQELQQQERKLQTARQALEQRVFDQTRDLAVAAQLAQRAATVRDRDTLLAEAVELIRTRFNLYYVQIYLTEANGLALLMRAGTGPVGRELHERGLRLPFGAGSLNGTAAAERRTVFVDDTADAPNFRWNPLLPHTRSEMCVPLLSGDQVTGVLDLQSDRPGTFSDDDLPVFEALAGQLVVTIQNANLFTAAEQAKTLSEQQTRRTARSNWRDFLNAVERQEQVGFTYADGTLTMLTSTSSVRPDRPGLATPLLVAGEPVGELRLEAEADSTWSVDERELVNAVSRQVAQQLENLRLLAQAEDFQSQAEEALRRLTGEGWEEHTSARLGYEYELNQKIVALPDAAPEALALTQLLTVRGETIGELALTGVETADDETAELVSAVADKLSAHLENLRLFEQTQAALRGAETLYALSSQLSSAATLEDILLAVVQARQGTDLAAALLHLYVKPANNKPEWQKLSAHWAQDANAPALQMLVGSRWPVTDVAFSQDLIQATSPLLCEDILSDPRIDEASRALLQSLGARAVVFVPLWISWQRLGLIRLIWNAPRSFAPAEVRLYEAIARNVSVVVNNRLLFEETQRTLAEQVRLAAESDSQRATLETVLFNIPAGVFVAEAPSGKHILSNSRAQAMLGRGIAVEANDESLAETYPVFRADTEDIYPPAEAPLARAMLGETTRVDDMEIRHPDGSRAWLEVVGAPIRDAQGRITASVAIFQDITERRQADANIRRRNLELGALNRVGGVLTSSFNLRTILQATTREIVTILRVRSASIALLDSSRQNLSVVADYSAIADIPSVMGQTVTLVDTPSSYRVFETKRPILVENAQTNSMVTDIHELMRARRTQTLLIVPLLARGEVIGTFTVETGQAEQTITLEEIALVETVAGQVASAVENIRLFENAQRRARELEAVAEVGTAASTVLDPQALLQKVVDLTKSSFSLYQAHIYLLNDAGDMLVLAAGAGGVGQSLVAEGRRIALGAEQSLVARAARSRRGIVVNDVHAEPGFLLHPLLSETRSELAVPLIAGDKVLGVFDVQSEIPGRFTEEDVRIQTTLANQVAVAWQNAATFTQVVEARSQIEAQARRLTHEGWADFLNAIDHPERLGYLYDQTRVMPLAEMGATMTNGHGLSVPIIVTGETVGSVLVESAVEHDWGEAEKTIATLVTQRLSQQVENLRLLDQAQRFRAEAENAIRRLTRAGWQSYEVASPAFVYDYGFVTPLVSAEDNGPEPTVIAQPITVRGEVIGQVGVAGMETVSAQQTELVTLVAQRLSSHIENLRLFDQTQTALSTTQSLYNISSRIAVAGDLQGVLAAVGEGLPIPGINRLLLFTHERDDDGELDAAVVAGNWYSGEGTPPTPVGQRYPRAVFNTFRLMLSPTPVFFNDLQADPRTDSNTQAIAQQLSIRAVVSLPLRAGSRQVGSLLLEGEVAHAFTDQEIQPYLSVAETVAIALENHRLAEATQAALAETEDQAHRLALLNEMGEQLNRAITLDDLFTVTVAKTREIFGVQWSSLYVLTEARTHYEVISLFNNTLMRAPVAEGTTETRFNLVGSMLEDMIREPHPMVTPDTRSSAMFDLRGMAARGMLSALQAPLLVGGRVMGTLNASSSRLNAFGPREVNLMQQMVALVSTTIENRRLLEQTQKRAAELETVAKVSATASAILEADQLLQIVVDLTKGSFGLYHTHAYMLDDAGEILVLRAGAGRVGSQMVAEGRRIPMSWEQSLVARAARTRQAVVANDVHTDPDFLPHPLLPDTRSELAVPMIVGDILLGVFDVQANVPNYFTDEDVRIQNTLAAQIAVALHNANLYSDQSATVARLRELDHLKSSFLANMSHELRTPLNSILGFTEVILEELDGPLTEQMENDLRIVYKNGQHLLHLINDVLDMAKIESGKLTLHPERLDLTEVLEEVIGLTNPLASAKDIELRLDAEFGTLEAEVDRIRIRQVMINIINNAIKFTEHGHIDIRAVPRNDFIRITVRDTGLGIPPNHLESIFQEFTQVDTTTTRKAGGTGLGLPISRHLVEMHGGKLWAESSGLAGEGSTFFVELPVNATYTAPVDD